jgi:hypothetical protein
MEFVLESIIESILESILKFVMLEKYSKSNGLSECASGPTLGGGLDANSNRPCTLINNLPCRIFIHELFLGPLGLHLLG